jgi:hypothetical protein
MTIAMTICGLTEGTDMVDFDALGLSDEHQNIAHEFEVDLNCLVIVNHKLTLEGIARAEQEDVSKFDLRDEDQRSMASYVENFYEDLRYTAHNLAVVGLVTRLQHWIGRYASELPTKRKTDRSSLTKELRMLNERLGDGPVPISFFKELVNVRDSVIHADSRPEWEYPPCKPRRVADCYRNSYGGVKLEEEQLKEAFANSIKQVVWYDENLLSLKNNARREAR